MKLQDLTGLQFSRLSVIGRSENHGKHVRWSCVCDCGKSATVSSTHLKTGQHPTACDAFHANSENGLASGQRNTILRFIETAGGSWSIGELAEALEMQKSTISARVFECLHEFGLLVVKAKRKDRVSQITIRPVGLPVKQLELLN